MNQGSKMINLQIENPIVDNFYYNICDNNKQEFIDKIVDFVQIYTQNQNIYENSNSEIIANFKEGIEELKKIKSGELKAIPIEKLLDELYK